MLLLATVNITLYKEFKKQSTIHGYIVTRDVPFNYESSFEKFYNHSQEVRGLFR